MSKRSNPSKIATIIKHEYMIRFRSKGFIISTLFGPLMLIMFFGVIIAMNVLVQDETSRKIAILDKSGRIGEKVVQLDSSKYYLAGDSEEVLREKTLKEEIDGYLLIPENFIEKGDADVFSRGGGGIGFVTSLSSNIGRILRHERLLDAGADMQVIKLVEQGVNIRTQKITEKRQRSGFCSHLCCCGLSLRPRGLYDGVHIRRNGYEGSN